MPVPEEISMRLRQLLNDKEMTAAELARRLKVSQPTVHAWLNASHGMRWENARRLARELDVSPAWIMFGTNSEAERTAQNGTELAFLRMYRDLDDDGQASLLRMMHALKKAASPS